MNIAVVSGSSRPNSQSRKIAEWVTDKAEGLHAQAYLIDLCELKLPTDLNLDVAKLDQEPEALNAWRPVCSIMQQADGFVFISPEWNGMAPPALLNFILYAAADETKLLAHKPIQLIGVSGNRGGDYPIAELRAFGMKNALGVYLPGHIVVRRCRELFNSPEPAPGNKDDGYIQKRTMHALGMLLEYAQVLTPMRKNAGARLLDYPNGM